MKKEPTQITLGDAICNVIAFILVFAASINRQGNKLTSL
jgi:hypothetical protein